MSGSESIQRSLEFFYFCVKRCTLSLVTKYSLSSLSPRKGIKNMSWKTGTPAGKSLWKLLSYFYKSSPLTPKVSVHVECRNHPDYHWTARKGISPWISPNQDSISTVTCTDWNVKRTISKWWWLYGSPSYSGFASHVSHVFIGQSPVLSLLIDVENCIIPGVIQNVTLKDNLHLWMWPVKLL